MNDPVRQAIDSYIASHSLGCASDYKFIFVPGRVEILGKHTDYAGGSSIVAALSRGIRFAYRPRHDELIEVHATDLEDSALFNPTSSTTREGHWSAYFLQAAKRVVSNFSPANAGATIVVSSSLPRASGMSSSSAIVIGAFLCLADINSVLEHPSFRSNIVNKMELADYLSTVENGGSFKTLAGSTGVGTLGGSEDHTAILASQASQLGWFGYRPTRLKQFVPFPDRLSLAIISSGVIAEKSGAAKADYNRSAQLCREVVELWNSETDSTAANCGEILRDLDFTTSRLRKALAGRQDLAQRFEHFFLEETRHIPDFISAVAHDDPSGMGSSITRSFEDANNLLENQIDETRALVTFALELDAWGASAFGAGFGGSVYALVPTDYAVAFLHEWESKYKSAFPKHSETATAFLDRPRDGVSSPLSI